MSLPIVMLPLLGLLPLATDAVRAPPPPPPPVETPVALTMVEERMTVPVQIAGAGPFRFVIDTGSERTVISRQLAGTLGLASAGDVMVVAMSGRTRVGTVVIPSLRLSSVPGIGRIDAPALDATDLGAMGLLGIDTLQNHKVTIDLDAKAMAVSPSVKLRRTPAAAPGEIVVRAKSTLGQLIVTDAQVDGRAVRIVLDTGSAVTIGNLALKRLMQRTGRFQPLTLYSATGGTVTADYGRAGTLRLGSIQFSDMPIAFADVAPFAHFGLDRRPALMLGMDALRQFRRVDIDFANREARFLMQRGVPTTTPCRVGCNRASRIAG
ncbi:aspartyl protease family protein [Sphingomonas floccifaciens]|uniref:Aspartyl protease family protein n=1 Tax=Sphingomonas floccifaciens TaxID=1844115 RepID=A0ABW4NEN3_9SPHN